jgi:TPR repeat protein
MNQKYIIVLSVLLALAPASMTLAQGRGFDAPTLRLQAKADNLYRKGHWERAHFIYVNELAAAGDKYSQYMAGYMCQHGKGVERDKIRASAWYRLAAERDGPEFVAMRDQLLESMSEEERQASDAIFLQLRQKYSDLVLMLDSLEDERDAMNEKPTGSRLSASASSITVIDPQSGDMVARSEYMRRLEKRMQARLDYLADKIGSETLDADMTDQEFGDLRQRVVAYLQVVNDR